MGCIKELYDKSFWNAYNQVKRFLGFYMKQIPFEDVAQEILIAKLSGRDLLSESTRNVRRLVKEYGYNCTLKTKDNFDLDVLYPEASDESRIDWIEQTALEVKEMYKSKSAKDILNHYGIEATAYRLISISRMIGGKKEYKKKRVEPYSKDIAERIFKEQNISRNAFRQWKYNGYIPAKYIEKLKVYPK